MIDLLRKRRAHGRIAESRRKAARIDRERAPLEYARAARDIAELYAEVGNRGDTIRWYGHAIDGYLQAGLTGAAAAMCRKLIEIEPRVVRARATLAMLHLADGRDREAIEEIRNYVDATMERGEKIELTRHRLRVFAEVAEDLEVRTAIGESLQQLGESAASLTSPSKPPCGATDQDRWNRLLNAVLLEAVHG